MGRTAVARALVLALTSVLASLALLLGGSVDVLPRGAAAQAAVGSAASSSAGTATRPGAVEAPSPSLALRAAGLAAVPAPTGPGGGTPPTAGPLVAPHLVADPQSRPPSAPLPVATVGVHGSRAPPGPAGT